MGDPERPRSPGSGQEGDRGGSSYQSRGMLGRHAALVHKMALLSFPRSGALRAQSGLPPPWPPPPSEAAEEAGGGKKVGGPLPGAPHAWGSCLALPLGDAGLQRPCRPSCCLEVRELLVGPGLHSRTPRLCSLNGDKGGRTLKTAALTCRAPPPRGQAR